MCFLSRMKTREKKGENKVENLEKENQKLRGNLSSVSVELSDKTKENKKLADKIEVTEKQHEKVKNDKRLVFIPKRQK